MAPRRKKIPDLPEDAFFPLASLRMCRLMTRVSLREDAYEPYPVVKEKVVVDTIVRMLEIGQSTFFFPPPSDRYLGSFRRHVGRTTAENAQYVHPITIPNLPSTGMTRRLIEDAVDSCLLRSNGERLDVVMLDWPDPFDLRYMDALALLQDISRTGKIRENCIGVINFTVSQLKQVLSQGIYIVCNCVELSILKQRTCNRALKLFCSKNNIKLLARNPLADGLLTSRWLGVPEPVHPAISPSYDSIMRSSGGWGIVQECLFCLHSLADKHKATVAQVALRWVLQQGVDAVVFEASSELMGSSTGDDGQDCVSNNNIFQFVLDETDLDALKEISKHSSR